jgi:hypothetical protein
VTFLRTVLGGWWHYCPACDAVHRIGSEWTFDHNMTKPTFRPSVRHRQERTDGLLLRQCHYFLVKGQIDFCTDCSHAMAGQTVALPAMPARFDDAYFSGGVPS